MKELTLKRINKIALNYLSLSGLQTNSNLDMENPVMIYFINCIMKYKGITSFDINKLNIVDISEMVETALYNYEKIPCLNMNNTFFHIMVKELYNTYTDLDNLSKTQNPQVKEILINFIGNESGYQEYMNTIINQYRESFFDLIDHYNSQNYDYNMIKISVLTEKMNEFATIENYEEAAKMRDKIIKLKEMNYTLDKN